MPLVIIIVIQPRTYSIRDENLGTIWEKIFCGFLATPYAPLAIRLDIKKSSRWPLQNFGTSSAPSFIGIGIFEIQNQSSRNSNKAIVRFEVKNLLDPDSVFYIFAELVRPTPITFPSQLAGCRSDPPAYSAGWESVKDLSALVCGKNRKTRKRVYRLLLKYYSNIDERA